MPLLKGRFMIPLEPKLTTEQKDTVYTIEHTEEKFTSKDAYEKKLRVYDASLWTCQCTGHINLKHKEAIQSEKDTRRQVLEKFPEVFEKTVLESVHHCSDPLDTLVDRSSLQLYEYMVPGEPASLKLKAGNKIITGNIIKADPQPKENAGSPSSDKENQDKPNTGGANSESPKSPHKGLPKLAPCKYSFKLSNEDKIVNGIPFSDLLRSTKIPNKDLLKLFIRCFGSRGGYFANSPWIVDKDLCDKHGIKDKAHEGMMSPDKRIEMARKAFEETAKEYDKKKSRRSNSTTSVTSPVRYGAGKKNLLEKKVDFKQPRLSFASSKSSQKSSEKSSPKKTPSTPTSKKTLSTPSKNTSSKTHLTPTKKTPKKSLSSTKEGSDSEEEISLLDLKNRSPKKTPLKKMPTKRKVTPDSSDSEEEISLAELKKRSPKKSPTKSPRKKSSSVSNSQSRDGADDLVKKKSKSEKTEKKKREKEEKNSKGKKLKQATLFDMKGGGKASPTTKKANSPTKPRMKTQPLVVEKLLKELKKKDGGNKMVVSQLVSKCARELNEKQRKNVPEPATDLVHQKWLKVEEKKKLEKMTEEERKEYYKEKQRQRVKEFLKKKNKKFEDTDLELTPLPAPKLVPTPDGVPNELFGDVTMLTEFVNSYRGLLMPDNEEPIYTDQLLKALSAGKEGFYYTAKVLKILLQTLLQDDLTSDYKELTVPLSEIPVNEFTASELVRLCLRKHDGEGTGSEVGSDNSEDTELEEVSEELLEQLESCEVYELSPQSQLELLSGMTHRLMSSYTVQDYMQEKLTQASELWRKRNQMLKQKNDLLKQEKVSKKIQGAVQKEESSESSKADGMTLKNFYGAKDSGIEDSDEDMATVIKRRRLNAAKDKEERMKREKEEKIKKDKEYELYKKLEETGKFEKTFTSGVHVSKMVQRVAPIGSDRNHNRYWVFSHGTPGIYVEKGWANKDIEYSTRPKDAESDEDESSSSEEEEQQEQNERKARAKRGKCYDKTIPHQGQNLWFVYDCPEDVDSLVNAFHPQGAREGPLQQEVKKIQTVVVDSLRKVKAKSSDNETTDCAEEMDLLTAFREELSDMENRLSAGNLGGVVDYDKWETDLKSAKTLEQFGECLKQTEVHIVDKFRTGELKKLLTRAEITKIDNVHNFMKTREDFKGPEKTFDKEGNSMFEETFPVCQLMWRDAVDNCPTWSRLHVLMGILNSCIKWEMSAENAKCKICQKKGEDEALLLCDNCNKAFHMYCLRPRLDEVPAEDWFCAACTPTDQRRRSRGGKTMGGDPASNQVSGESEGEELQHDTQCTVCSGEDKLILCATCISAFHLDCHDPPLRREPRNTWRCIQCTSGIRIRKSKRAAAKKRKRYTDDFVEDWEDEDEKPRKKRKTEEEIVKVDTSKSRSERYKNRYGFESEEEEDEEEEESSNDSETDTEEVTTLTQSQELEEYLDGETLTKSSRNKKKILREVENVCDTPPQKSTPADQSPTPPKKKPRSKPRVNGEVNTHEVEMRNAEEILGKLRRHKHSWPFQDPVDPSVVPDYYEIVKKPMDFYTMKKKCESNGYQKVCDFVEDLAQVFTNCELYNKPDTEVYKCIAPLEKIVRENIKRLLPGVCYPRNGNPVVDHDYL